jgi:uncharacterized membrane protein
MLQDNGAPPTTEKIGQKPDPLTLAYELQGISPWRQDLSRRVTRSYIGFWGFIGDHWLAILNGLNIAILAAAFATPFLLMAGWETPAGWFFGLFQYVCVQNPAHTFFIGGKPMCVCQRCLAIYGGMLLAGAVFYFVRHKLQPLKFWQFALFFCVPIAIDGFTQMFGWRESTPELRLFTGSLFAVGLVWALYPLCQRNFGRLSRWARRELSNES